MNSSFQVDINDVTLAAPVVTRVEMEVMEMVLNSHVLMVVHYLNAAGNLLDNKYVKISGDEYNAWGDDDNYIINLVLTKLGLTKIV
jgi:hypothetical protein